MSIAPIRPLLSFLMTSGDMYIGVPVKLAAPASPVSPPPRRDLFIVFVFLASILAAPKSTNLITPWWSSRISAAALTGSSDKIREK